MTDYTPHEAPAKSITDLPVMHPGRPVGRDDKLKEIYAHLRANKVVYVHGPSGAGKTALAAALASAYTQQAGGVLWLNVNNAPLLELIVRVGRAYGDMTIANSDNPLGMVGAVTALLTQHKPFIVIDGKPDAKAVGQFLSKCAETLPGLIVSETEADGPWEKVSLGALGDTDAAVLFKQKAGIADNASDIDVYGLCKTLGYMPFPIVIVARALAASKQKPGDYLKALQQIAAKIEDDKVMLALTASYRALSTALQGLLLMMGASSNGEASADLLSIVSGVSSDSVDQAMNVLSQLYLVERFERYGEPYYRLHEKAFIFAQAWLKGSNRLEGLQAKFRDSYAAYVQKYIAPNTGSDSKIAAEMDGIVSTARAAAEVGERDFANKMLMLLTQGTGFVKVNGYVYELLLLRNFGSGSTTAFPAYAPEAPLAEVEEEETFDVESEDDFDYDIVEDVEEDEDEAFDLEDDELDDLDEDDDFGADDEVMPTDTAAMTTINIEQLRSALNQAKQQKDILRQIQILKAIGKVQITQGKDTEAIATYNELLTAYESIGDNEGILETLDMLSSLLTKTDNSQAAVLHATRGLQLADELGVYEQKVSVLMTLGDARQNLGESEAAVGAFTRALALTRANDDRQNEALSLYKLGFAQLDDGNAETAIETWEQALSLFRDQKKRDYEGRVLGGLGLAYGELNQWSEAIKFHTSALYIAREVRDRQEEALQLSSLGQALVESNQLPDALLRYRQALHLAYESGDRDNIVSAIVDLVSLMLRSNRLLDICAMLMGDAARLEPNDKDVKRLQERIASEKANADEKGVQQAPVAGNARDYASNAYALLEQ